MLTCSPCSKEKAGASWKAGVLSILVHFLQLIVTVITNHFSWDFQGAWWATAVQATGECWRFHCLASAGASAAAPP